MIKIARKTEIGKVGTFDEKGVPNRDWLDKKDAVLNIKADGKGTYTAGNHPYADLLLYRSEFERTGILPTAFDIEKLKDDMKEAEKQKKKSEKSSTPAAPDAEAPKPEVSTELDLSYQQGVIPAQESTSECRKAEPAKVTGHFKETIYNFDARLKNIKTDGGDGKPRIKILTLVTTDLEAISGLDYVVGNIVKVSIPVTEWVNGTNPDKDAFDDDAAIDAEIGADDAGLEKDEVKEPTPADIQINNDADHTPVPEGEVKTTLVCPKCGGEPIKNPDDPAGLKCAACGELVSDPACEPEEDAFA